LAKLDPCMQTYFSLANTVFDPRRRGRVHLFK
jgi:hypothetical protein